MWVNSSSPKNSSHHSSFGLSERLLFVLAKIELKIDLTDEQFWQLCRDNRDRQFERTATGILQIIVPIGGETGNCNIEVAYQIQGWSRGNNLGKATTRKFWKCYDALLQNIQETVRV
ncbi:MAG: hypothetical protein VKN72_00990 [Nostocales cyanobacterium 94392]|nr:hypothetical protein [Nostocales cyanobacterium 94392]